MARVEQLPGPGADGSTATAPGRPAGGRRLPWLARGAIALAIVVGWLELGTRYLFGVYPLTKESVVWQYDPELGWWHEPGKAGMFVKQDCRQAIAINSLGLREREIGYAKPPGVTRILVLGNSVTVGFEVPPEEVFTRVMEDELARLGCKAQVINAACRGWGSDQALIYLRREGLKYHPDLVLYCTGGIELGVNVELHRPYRTFGKGYFEIEPGGGIALRNVPVPHYPMDVVEHLDDRGKVVRETYPASRARWLWFRDNVVSRSSALTLAIQSLTTFPLLSRLVAERGAFQVQLQGVESGDEGIRASYAYRVTAATYKAMNEAAAGAGARFLVGNPSSIDHRPWPWEVRLIEDAGLPFWDLGPESQSWLPRGVPFRLPHDAHFNKAGHEAVGIALARGLVARGLVPAAGPGR